MIIGPTRGLVFRSEKGLERHGVLRSLFETAKRQGKKAHSFFLDVFTKDTAEAQAARRRSTANRSCDQTAAPSCVVDAPPIRCARWGPNCYSAALPRFGGFEIR